MLLILLYFNYSTIAFTYDGFVVFVLLVSSVFFQSFLSFLYHLYPCFALSFLIFPSLSFFFALFLQHRQQYVWHKRNSNYYYCNFPFARLTFMIWCYYYYCYDTNHPRHLYRQRIRDWIRKGARIIWWVWVWREKFDIFPRNKTELRDGNAINKLRLTIKRIKSYTGG